jgi:hypothetical protein
MISLPGGIIIALIILAALFIALREAVCWYWKINRAIRLLETAGAKIDALGNAVKVLAANQSLLMQRIPVPRPSEPIAEPVETYDQWDTDRLLTALKSPDYDLPTKERLQKVLAARYGIRYEEGKYRYRDYVSDAIEGAVECARLYTRR